MDKESRTNSEKVLEIELKTPRSQYLPLEQTNEDTANPQLFAAWSHKPGFIEACILTLSLSTTAGILIGYPESLEVIIMAKGASYSDQAVLSLNSYPVMFKIFIVPFLDTYYINMLGKSKTVVLVSGITLFFLLFSFGAHSETLIANNSIWVITILWFFITIFSVLMLLGADVLAMTLFEGDRKYMAGILLATGVSFGNAIGYNLFVLLNSPEWWNEHIFKDSSWKLEKEILGHKEFVRGVSVLILGITVYTVFFVKEKVIEGARTNSLTQTFRKVREMVKVTPIFRMMLIFVLYEIFVFMFNKSVELKFIENGVNKTSLVSIQSSILSIKLALMALAPLFAKRAYLIRQVLGFQIGTVTGSLILAFLVWGLSRGSSANSVWMMVGFLLREMHYLSQQLMFSKVTEVIPEEIGATAYTIFAVLRNTGNHIPSSIGLKIVDKVSQKTFFVLVFGSFFVQFVVIGVLWPLAVKVDQAKIEDFRVIRPKKETNRYAEEVMASAQTDEMLLNDQ